MLGFASHDGPVMRETMVQSIEIVFPSWPGLTRPSRGGSIQPCRIAVRGAGKYSNYDLTSFGLGLYSRQFPLNRGRSLEASGWRSGEAAPAAVPRKHGTGSPGTPSAGTRPGCQELARKEARSGLPRSAAPGLKTPRWSAGRRGVPQGAPTNKDVVPTGAPSPSCEWGDADTNLGRNSDARTTAAG